MAKRKFLGLLGFVTGVVRRAACSTGARPAVAATGSTCTSTTARWCRSSKDRRRRRSCCPSRGMSSRPHDRERSPSRRRSSSTPTSRATSCCAPGRRSRYYLDKYRFETRPDLLQPLGERIAATVQEHAPDATRLAGPELGAVALAAAASLQSGLPFIIVRKAAKEYGTAKRIEGPYEEGECICLIEDVVTSGGALLDSIEALRGAGLVVHTAVCVVDREEGGADALARHAVRLRPLFRAGELSAARKVPQNRMVEP